MSKKRSNYVVTEVNKVMLRVGAQSFTVYEWDGDDEEDARNFYEEMLSVAISNLTNEIKRRIVNQVAKNCKARPDGKPCDICNDFIVSINMMRLEEE